MTEFVFKKLPYDLGSQAGVALVGKALRQININALVDPAFPVRSGHPNSAIFKAYLALLVQGKNDFEAIEQYRRGKRGDDAFFMRAMGLAAVPSSATLRQRLDAHASSWFDLAERINEAVLGMKVNGRPIDFGAMSNGYTALDIDTFCMDNSHSAKEWVGRTYSGVDGNCRWRPIWAARGLDLALRPGTQHSTSESLYKLERVLPMACKLVSTPLLVRMDSGFCSQQLMQELARQGTASSAGD